MADKTKQYEDLKQEIEWKIRLYKCDLEEVRKKEEQERKERELRLNKLNKELEEFQTIGKMLNFILDCQKRKSSPKSRKIPPKNYGS